MKEVWISRHKCRMGMKWCANRNRDEEMMWAREKVKDILFKWSLTIFFQLYMFKQPIEEANSRFLWETDWFKFGLFSIPIHLSTANCTKIGHVTHFWPNGCQGSKFKCLERSRVGITVANWSLRSVRGFQFLLFFFVITTCPLLFDFIRCFSILTIGFWLVSF